MFGTLGGPELFLIFIVALIVFGPRKLPDIGKSLGRMMSEFRRASNEFKSTIESEVESEKIRDSMRLEPPKVTRAGSQASPPTGSKKPGATASAADGEGGSAEDGAPAGAPKAPKDAPTQEAPSKAGQESSSEGSSSGETEKSETPPAASPSPGEPVPATVSRQPPAPESK